MNINPFFLLFLALAVLLALNGLRAIVKGVEVRQGTRVTGVRAYVSAILYLAAAVGIAVAGYYMFQF